MGKHGARRVVRSQDICWREFRKKKSPVSKVGLLVRMRLNIQYEMDAMVRDLDRNPPKDDKDAKRRVERYRQLWDEYNLLDEEYEKLRPTKGSVANDER